MSDDFLENLTSLTDNLNDIAFTRYVTITNVNADKTVDCQEDNGTLHKNVINTTNLNLDVDDVVLLGFVDNNIYNPMITGGVTVKAADDTMIYALGLGKFNINEKIFTFYICSWFGSIGICSRNCFFCLEMFRRIRIEC